MAYQLYYPWRKHPRMLYLNFTEQVSMEDVEAALAQAIRLMEESNAPVHILFSFAQAEKMSDQLLKTLQKSGITSHSACGYLVFVQPNEFISFVAKLLRQQTQVAIEFAEHDDAAWDFFNLMGIC